MDAVRTGIAIIGMTTAAKQLLDAAELSRRDEAAAGEKLADAIACAQEAYRAFTGNDSPVIPLRLCSCEVPFGYLDPCPVHDVSAHQ